MISVAMTTYNGEKYIIEQLQSMYDQSRKIDELIICDDGSDDQTIERIHAFQRSHSDMKIRLVRNQKNLGYRCNFKKAMSLCEGDYVFLCDQDDRWQSEKVASMLLQMQKHPEIMVLASSFTFMDAEGKPIEVKPLRGFSNNNTYTRTVAPDALVEVRFEEFLAHNYFQGCSLCLTKAIKEEVVAHFSTKIHHDWLINLTAAKYQGMYFWNHPLFYYRIHEHNTIGTPAVNYNKWKRLKETNTLDVRIKLAQEVLDVLEALQESDPKFCERPEVEFQQRKEWHQKHIEYLSGHQLLKLISQNRSPYYGQLKTRNARMMDILFILQNKL